MYVQVDLEPQPQPEAVEKLDAYMTENGFTKNFPDLTIAHRTEMPRGTYVILAAENTPAQIANAIHDGIKALNITKFVKVLALQTGGGAMVHN